MALSASERIARAQAALAALTEEGVPTRSYAPSERLFQSLELRRGAAPTTVTATIPAVLPDDVLSCVPAYRNLFVLSCIRAVSHHVTLHVRLADGSTSTERFSGTPASMKRATCLVRGPCCATSAHDDGNALADDSNEDARAACDAALQACAACIPGSTVLRTLYGGAYGECTLTELISSPSSLPDTLKAQLRSDLASMDASTSALHRLDVECMLSILQRPTAGPTASASRAIPRNDAPFRPPAGVGDSALQVGHFMLRFDAGGRLLLRDASPTDLNAVSTVSSHLLAPCITTDIASLHSTKLRASSPWVDFNPTSHGRLMSSSVQRSDAAVDGDVIRLLRAAREAWRASVSGVYVNPLHTSLQPGIAPRPAVGDRMDSSSIVEHKDARSCDAEDVSAPPASWMRPPENYSDVHTLTLSLAPHGRHSKRLMQQPVQVALNRLAEAQTGPWPRRVSVQLKLPAPLTGLHVSVLMQVGTPPTPCSDGQLMQVVVEVTVAAGEQQCGRAAAPAAAQVQLWSHGVVTCGPPLLLQSPLLVDVHLPTELAARVGHDELRMLVEEQPVTAGPPAVDH